MKLYALSAFLALVAGRQGFGPGDQEWGYVTVREGAHMFWWLYLTPGQEQKPLIIWLQGGPGASSSGIGNFQLIGPLDTDLQPRNITWTKHVNVLFVDSPVGTGFSHIDNSSTFPTNNRQVALDLVQLLIGFYQKMPTFKSTPLYIVGESYGAKMGVEFALELYKAIKAERVTGNFQGVMIGDPWISPLSNVMNYADFLWQFGEVDMRGRQLVQASSLKTKLLTLSGRYEEAYATFWKTMGVISSVTHQISVLNIFKEIRTDANHEIDFDKPIEDPQLLELMETKVKPALGLEVKFAEQGLQCLNALIGDFMKPVKKIVEKLLRTNDLKVYVFTGQLDVIVNTPGTVTWVDNLKWPGSSNWKNASRNAYAVDGIYEGYSKEVDNFALFWVHQAGHMVPNENPKAMEFILKKLTTN